MSEVKEKPWKVEFKDEPMFSIIDGIRSECHGYFKISFEGYMYGTIGSEAFDDKKTGEILSFVEHMLNDAHQLALKEHD